MVIEFHPGFMKNGKATVVQSVKVAGYWTLATRISNSYCRLSQNHIHLYRASQELYTRATLCCLLLWFGIGRFTRIHRDYPSVSEVTMTNMGICTTCTDYIATAKQSTSSHGAYVMGYTALVAVVYDQIGYHIIPCIYTPGISALAVAFESAGSR